MKQNLSLCILVFLTGFHSIAARAALPTSYDFTLLESPNVFVEPFSINNASQIVGSYSNESTSLPFVWEGNTLIDLSAPGMKSGIAYSINSSGQIAGNAVFSGSDTCCATVWNNRIPTQLSPLVDGYGTSAWGINDAGKVVGGSGVPDPYVNETPVVWNGTTPSPLPTLGIPAGSAHAINNSGQITGLSNLAPAGQLEIFHAMLWQGDSVTDLGVLPGGSFSIGLSINDKGQVVGNSSFDGTGTEHGFLWADGQMIDLGAIGDPDNHSDAFDINNLGQIVGSTEGSRATIWDTGKLYDLNSFLDASVVQDGWILAQANSINDLGQIVGVAFNPLLGVDAGFLLTPSPVPEPESYAMLIAGLGVLTFVARVRSRAWPISA